MRARALIGALVLQFSLGLVYVWGAMAPYARAHDRWSPLLIGAVWSAGPLGYGAGILVAGRLADRLPPRRLCWASLAMMAAGLAVTFAIPAGLTFPVFYSGVGLGLGGGVGMAGSVAAGVQAFPRRAGLAGGAATSAYALAALVQVPVASGLAPEIGWVNTLRVMGSVLVVLAALALLLMPALPIPARAAEAGSVQAPLAMLRRPLVWTAFAAELATGIVGSAAFVNLVTYARALGVALALATAALTAMAVGNAVGRLAGGAAADRLGVDTVLLAVLGMNLVAVILLWQLSEANVLAAGLTAGLAFGGGAGILPRLGARAAPGAPNSAFGLIFLGYSSGAFSGPLLMALTGLSMRSWLLMAAFPIAGFAVLAYRWRVPA